MKRTVKSPLARHRARKLRQGLVRVEVSVRKEDADLVREVATALSDPTRQARTRILLQRISAPPKLNLKELLGSGPPDDIDLSRPRDFGRDVKL